MGKKMGHPFLLEISDKLIYIVPKVHNVAETIFGNVKSHHMELASVLRQVRRQFCADERSGEVGDLKRPVYGIMVADRNIVHALLHRRVIDEFGFCIALGAVELAKSPA